MSDKAKTFWEEETGEEWCNFVEGVPIDIVIENAEPEEVELIKLICKLWTWPPHTTWGVATIIRVWEYQEGELKGGIRKLLRINSKRLRRGLRNASIGGIPAKGNGYRLIRRGEGWSTTYNVSWLGKFKIYPTTGTRESIPEGSGLASKKS